MTFGFPQATITVYADTVALVSRSVASGTGFDESGQLPNGL